MRRNDRSKYLSLLGISLFSFVVLQQTTVAHAAANVPTNDQVTQVASSSVKSDKERIVLGDKSVEPTGSNLDQNGQNKSDSVKGEPQNRKPVAEAESLNSDVSDPDKSQAAVDPSATAPKDLVVVKKNDSSVHLDNKLKISTAATPNLKTVDSSSAANATYDDTSKTVTITDPVDSDAITADYGVVGTYQGKNVTAKVTISHLIIHSADHPAPSNLPANEVQIKFHPDFGGGIETYNIAQDEVTIAFFDEKGNPITIDKDGYITVGSLNGPSTSTMGNEYVDYDNPDTSAYVTEDSVVKYQTNPVTGTNNAYVGTSSDFTDKLGAPTSENGAVTFQLSGNTFNFLTGTTRYTLKNANHHWSYSLTTFESATVAPSVLPKPVLSVDKTSAKAGDTVNYTLKQQVNTLGEDTLLRYQTWTQTVTLPSEVTFKQGNLLDGNGQVIAGAVVTYDEKTHQVTVTLPADYLQSTMPLNAETYSLELQTTVNKGVSNGENGIASGNSDIDSTTTNSNTVDTVYIAPVPAKQPASITVYDMDNRGNLLAKRVINGVVGGTYNIKPLKTDVSELMYLDASKPLSGTFTDDKTAKITLLYGLTYQVSKDYGTTRTALLTYNGNDDLIIDDELLMNGNTVEINYTAKGAKLIWQDGNGRTVASKEVTSLHDTVVLKHNGSSITIKLLGDAAPNVVASGRAFDEVNSKTTKIPSVRNRTQYGKGREMHPMHVVWTDSTNDITSRNHSSKSATDSRKQTLPQTNEAGTSFFGVIGLIMLGLLSFFKIGRKEND